MKKKITKRTLQLGTETVRVLAGSDLQEVNAGLPTNSGDDCPPTTFTDPTCDGQSCAVTECANCYSARKKPCLG